MFFILKLFSLENDENEENEVYDYQPSKVLGENDKNIWTDYVNKESLQGKIVHATINQIVIKMVDDLEFCEEIVDIHSGLFSSEALLYKLLE